MNRKTTCPLCDKQITSQYRPFCSKRCADVDLNRWLSGGYAVPGSDDDSEGATDDGMDIDNKPLTLQ
ncbi:MAG: DNA gyrase inhibitor YacG [Pseudomonadota bacterium]